MVIIKKKKLHPVLKVLLCLFIVFIALYIASESGYYESKVRDKVALTEESIKEFEEHIQNGDEFNLDAFLNNETVDYSNKVSKLGDNFTSSIEVIVTKSSEVITDIFKSLF